jgi:hypothetical protein
MEARRPDSGTIPSVSVWPALISAPAGRRAQAKELAVLALLYLLQTVNAEMLRRAAGSLDRQLTGTASGRIVADWALIQADHIHPVAMLVCGVWLAALALALGRGRRPPRWTFDGLGVWFSLRLLAEYLTINGLIFEGSKVEPGVLLGQIVLYLPYFVITWGWIFHRLDLVNQDQPGRIVMLSDADQARGISAFDYYHASISTLLNKGKPTIAGVSRTGRLLVLLYLAMVLGLYALTFARILQLTRSLI